MSMLSPTRTAASAATPDPAAAFRAGARAMVPWLCGVVPFGITVGVTIAESAVDPIAGWATGSFIYAGSAQLLAVELLDQGAAPLVVVATVLVVNARLVVYSGSMAPHWQRTGRGFRALAAYLLVDPSYAVGSDGYSRAVDRRSGHAHYLGCAVTLWLAWQAAIAFGVLAGDAVPDTSLLSLVVPFYLVAEIVRVADGRPAVTAAVTAAVAAVAGSGLPFNSGVLAAIAGGVAGAWFLGGGRR
jgi:predicted branched-subunit amino acid permease